jgi:hypothetical protein
MAKKPLSRTVSTSGGLRFAPIGRPRRQTNFGLPVTRADQGIKWGATKTNTVKGSPRAGAQYQEGVDPQTGQVYHRYAAQAGGLPAETVGVKQSPAEAAAFKAKRRALKSNLGSKAR